MSTVQVSNDDQGRKHGKRRAGGDSRRSSPSPSGYRKRSPGCCRRRLSGVPAYHPRTNMVSSLPTTSSNNKPKEKEGKKTHVMIALKGGSPPVQVRVWV